MVQKFKKYRIPLILLALSLIVLIVYATTYNQNITINQSLTVKIISNTWSQITKTFSESVKIVNNGWRSITTSFSATLRTNIPFKQIINTFTESIKTNLPFKTFSKLFTITQIIGKNFKAFTISFALTNILGKNFKQFSKDFRLSFICENCSFRGAGQTTTTAQSPSPSGINITSPNFFSSSNFVGIINLIIIAIFIFSPAFILLEITKSTLGFIFGAGLGTIILVAIGIIPMWILFLAIIILFALVFMRREVG